MSRVDEALKRAHSLKAGLALDGPSDLHTVESPIVPSWQYDRFPTECDIQHDAERRAPRRIDNAAASTARVTPPVTTPPPKIAIQRVAAGDSRVLAERIVGGRAAMAG